MDQQLFVCTINDSFDLLTHYCSGMNMTHFAWEMSVCVTHWEDLQWLKNWLN